MGLRYTTVMTLNDTTCSVDACDRAAHARGMCKAHYEQVRRSGSLSDGGRPIRLRLSWPESLLARMEPQPDGCIYYTGHLDDHGYGMVKRNGKEVRAHRAAYEHFVGPIPDGMWIDHECHNRDLSCLGGDSCPHRRCVNWEHLRPTTPRENIRAAPRSIAEKWAARTHCDNGHEFTPENTRIRTDGSGGRRCETCRKARRRLPKG